MAGSFLSFRGLNRISCRLAPRGSDTPGLSGSGARSAGLGHTRSTRRPGPGVMPRTSVETSVVLGWGSGSANSDQRVAGGNGGGLAPVGYPQLAEHVGDVLAGGVRTNEELLGDLRVGQALAEEGKHLPLTPG